MNVKYESLPKNRTFGFFFSFISLVVAAYFIYKSVLSWTVIFLCLAFLFLMLSIIRPSALSMLNKLWFHLGLVLAHIVSPLILAILFFVFISPVAIIMRFFGRDELRLKLIKRNSHWRIRENGTPKPSSFEDQY